MSEVFKSELDIFKSIPLQKSVIHSTIVEYQPTNVLSESTAIHFNITVPYDEFLDLQSVYFSLTGKITKLDGSSYVEADNDRYSLINYFPNTCFEQVIIYLNNELISQSSNTYHYNSYISMLTQADMIQTNSQLKASGFIDYNNVKYDELIDKRLSILSNKSRNFTLFARPHHGIFESDKLLIGGTSIRFVFNLASPKFCIIGIKADATKGIASDYESILKIINMKMYARKIKVSQEILKAHNEAFKLGRAIYPIRRTHTIFANLSAGQSVFSLNNIFQGKLPFFLVCGLVANDAHSGKYDLNPLVFNHHDLKYLCVHLNDESYPKVPYSPDYDNDNYQREYFEFFENIKCYVAIDYAAYKNINCLYAFNFRPDFTSPLEENYKSPTKNGFINIELRFKTNLTNALKLIVYAMFDSQIEIDETRNVYYD